MATALISIRSLRSPRPLRAQPVLEPSTLALLTRRTVPSSSRPHATSTNGSIGEISGLQLVSFRGPNEAPSGETTSMGASALMPHTIAMTFCCSGQVGVCVSVMSLGRTLLPSAAMAITVFEPVGRNAISSLAGLIVGTGFTSTSLVLPQPATRSIPATIKPAFREIMPTW